MVRNKAESRKKKSVPRAAGKLGAKPKFAKRSKRLRQYTKKLAEYTKKLAEWAHKRSDVPVIVRVFSDGKNAKAHNLPSEDADYGEQSTTWDELSELAKTLGLEYGKEWVRTNNNDHEVEIDYIKIPWN